MSRITSLALASAALVAGMGAAHAADIGRRPAPAYVPPPVVQAVPAAYNWSGAYVGLTGGYGWANFSNNPTVSDGSGFLGGGYVGYNVQMPSNWVLGIEADALWSGISGSAGAAESKIGWLSTLRGRVGYAFDRFLVYGTAGGAVASVTQNDGSVSDKNTHFGWTAGAGVEMALSQNVTARVEYNYVGLNDKDYSLTSTQTVGASANIIKAGIGFKF